MQIQNILEIILNKTGSAFFYTPSIYPNSKSYLFKNPSENFTVNNLIDFNTKLDYAEEKIKKGENGFIIIPYEFGYLFEKRSRNFIFNEPMRIFLFDKIKSFNSTEIEFDSNIKKNYTIDNFNLNINKEEYISSVNKIKNYISEGDTYQVNYTTKGEFNFEGDIISLFTYLIFNQSASYTCIINLGEKIIFSFSPELFFEIESNKIISKPMKGTIKRGKYFSDDLTHKNSLALSEKNKAENLMIVDLIRNDLGRIAKFNSVKVDSLFDIEKYESLFQMTSTISAEINDKVKLSEIIQNIFPCGSITGAPKIRTMEIIKELEKSERGIYTGTIGLLLNSKMTFNIPIRTIEIQNNKGKIGLGSGIVWDSEPEKEYEETLLKANFLLNPDNYFELFESILIENGKPFLFEFHLERLSNTAKYFIFDLNLDLVNNSFFKEISLLNKFKNYKIKLILNKWGRIRFETSEISPIKNEIKILISKNQVNSNNRFQYFKTTNRNLYDKELNEVKENGLFDIIYLNENGFITEGAISNIFVFKNEVWITPPINDGLLPGVYRKHLLSTKNNIMERSISLNELLESEKIMLTNSVRKEVYVSKLYINEHEYWEPIKT